MELQEEDFQRVSESYRVLVGLGTVIRRQRVSGSFRIGPINFR